jgi:hypothetical protein
MCCKRCKLYVFLVFLFALVVFFGAAMACGGLDFNKCNGHKKSKPKEKKNPPQPTGVALLKVQLDHASSSSQRPQPHLPLRLNE